MTKPQPDHSAQWMGEVFGSFHAHRFPDAGKYVVRKAYRFIEQVLREGGQLTPAELEELALRRLVTRHELHPEMWEYVVDPDFAESVGSITVPVLGREAL